jgi:hypothetical protein
MPNNYPCDKPIENDIDAVNECDDCSKSSLMLGCAIGRSPRFIFKSLEDGILKAQED